MTADNSTAVSQQRPVSRSNSAAVRQQQPVQQQPDDNREFSSNKLTHDNDNNSPVLDNNVCAEEGCQMIPPTTSNATGAGQPLKPSGRQRQSHHWWRSLVPATNMGCAWEQHQHNEETTQLQKIPIKVPSQQRHLEINSFRQAVFEKETSVTKERPFVGQNPNPDIPVIFIFAYFLLFQQQTHQN